MAKKVKGPHYLTVDGEPYCASAQTTGIGEITCQHEDSHAAIRALKKVRKLLPEAKVEIVEGKCPRPNAEGKH